VAGTNPVRRPEDDRVIPWDVPEVDAWIGSAIAPTPNSFVMFFTASHLLRRSGLLLAQRGLSSGLDHRRAAREGRTTE
jgi:hypothetical protein